VVVVGGEVVAVVATVVVEVTLSSVVSTDVMVVGVGVVRVTVVACLQRLSSVLVPENSIDSPYLHCVHVMHASL
jgi:hypothetical protein